MIYDEPTFRPAGDRYVLVELGNEMNLKLNFMAQGLGEAVESSGTNGIVETAPCFASLLVHYEPSVIKFDAVIAELKNMISSLGSFDDLELSSRIFYFPTLYLDPWTKECVEDYRARIAPKTPDPQLLVEENGLADTDELVRVHSSSEYWVASLGFWPGLPFMMPLDPRARLTAPKYNPPRTNTPQGAIGLGGAAGSIYPVATPGGYQIFARTPVPIWDPTFAIDIFEGEICLFKPGDRIRFVPVTREEYDTIDAQVSDGSYVYTRVDYQKFSVRHYDNWIANTAAPSDRGQAS